MMESRNLKNKLKRRVSDLKDEIRELKEKNMQLEERLTRQADMRMITEARLKDIAKKELLFRVSIINNFDFEECTLLQNNEVVRFQDAIEINKDHWILRAGEVINV